MNSSATDLTKFRKYEQELHLENDKLESYALHNTGTKNAAVKAFLALRQHERELYHVEKIDVSNTDAIPKLSDEELNHINKDQIEKFEKDMTPDDMGFEWDYNELPVEIREEFSEEIKLKKEHQSEGQNSTPSSRETTLTAEEELKILDEWANS
ncbi:hypothetical protein Ddc_18925 [Ditylenchus destructor]|nr:hypothetical protein Ddc_18925 [Ditylenchus destructor]